MAHYLGKFFGIAVVCAVLTIESAWAASPSLGNIIPRGAARGNTVDVAFHGGNLGDAVDIVFHDPGIKLVELTPEDKKVTCKLEIAPDCRVGLHAMRVRTKSGISNLRLFSVGTLNEINEDENINNAPDTAAVVPLGTTINGQIPNEDVDFYAVELEAGARLAAEVEAIRLGGAFFDPKLRLFSPSGHEIVAADDVPMMRQDAALVKVAEEAGRYVLAVSEAAYGGGGGFHYRLHVGAFPRPLAVTPMGGAPGSEVNVTWLGDPGLSTQAVALPAATGTSPVSPATDAGIAPTPVPFRVSEFPGVIEAEPNNKPEEATPGQAPGAFDGVIQADGDDDWFAFDGKKDQVFNIRVYAREMGSPLDSVLHVNKPDGSNLGSNDDAVGPDSQVRVTLPEDGRYTFRVKDHLSSGGATYAYRVEVTPVKPALSFTLVNNDPASVAIPQANRAYIQVLAGRADFNEALKVAFENLPAGVQADFDPVTKGTSHIPVVLSAAADAPVAGALADIVGAIDNEAGDITGSFSQRIKMILGQNRVVIYDHPVDKVAMAVTEPAPFSIDLVQPQVPIVKNGPMQLKVVATRSEGFNAPINLRVPWLPGGVSAGTTAIPEGANEITIPINANDKAAVGTHRIAVMGTSAGYAVSTALTPLAVSDPWVTFAIPKVETEQGKPVDLVVTANQAHEYEGAFQAQLYNLPKGVTADPVEFSHATGEMKFALNVTADAPEGKFQGVGVRATIQQHGEDIVHNSGGGQVVIYKPLPPELKEEAPAPEAPKEEEKKEEQPERKTRFPTT